MSRSANRLRALAEIHRLRQLSERRALGQLLRREHERAAAAAERDRQSAKLAEDVEGWEAALGVGSFDPRQLGNWSRLVADQRARERIANGALVEKVRDVDAAKRTHGRETGHRDVSASLLRSARRRHGAKIEERALAELADRWTGANRR